MKHRRFTGTAGDFPGRRIRTGIKLFLLVFLFFGEVNSWAQITRHYADSESHNSHVDNPGNAVDATNLTDFATLESYGGIAVGIGSYSGQLELQFPGPLPVGTTSYVHLDFDADALNALLGGNLGGALADLLGTVLLGNHYFNVEARLGTNIVLSGSSQNGFASEELRLIIDSNGDYFLAITPSSSYDRIFIEDTTNALLVGSTNSMKVYSAFYITGQDLCEPAFATSFDGSGGTVDVLDLGNNGVENPENAIDGDENTFSEIGLGLLTAAGSISQTIYFQSVSNATDQFHIVLAVGDPSLLGLGVNDGITIEALNGDTVVYTEELSTFLSLDLLNILTTGQPAPISFSPGVPFDRVRVTITSTLNLTLAKTAKLYGVYRSPPPPDNPWASGPGPTICNNAPAILFATTVNTNELRWYTDQFGGTPVAITPYNGTYTTTNLTTNTTFYVSAAGIGCAKDSERIPIEVTVLPDIDNPDLAIDMVED